MIEFILGVAVGAAFAPFWMVVGKAIWSRVKSFIEKYKSADGSQQ